MSPRYSITIAVLFFTLLAGVPAARAETPAEIAATTNRGETCNQVAQAPVGLSPAA